MPTIGPRNATVPPSMTMKTASPDIVQKANSGYAPETNRLMIMPPRLANMPARTKAVSRVR